MENKNILTTFFIFTKIVVDFFMRVCCKISPRFRCRDESEDFKRDSSLSLL